MWRQRYAIGLLFLVAILISYGSLYPFDFVIKTPFYPSWGLFIGHWNSDGRMADLLGNVVLFVPYGLVAMIAWQRLPRASRIVLVLTSALAIAFILQVAQIYLPTRNAAVSDVFWNVVGTALGVIAAAIVAPRSSAFLARLRVRGAEPALVGAWLVWKTVPFVPGVGWQHIKDSLKPLLLHPQFNFGQFLLELASTLVVAELVRGVSRRWRILVPVLLAGVLCAQIVVVNRVLDLTTFLALSVGALAWLLVAQQPDFLRRAGLFWILLLALTVEALAPFELRSEAQPFHWVPFASILEGSVVVSVSQLASMLFVYGAMFWLVLRQAVRLVPVVVAISVWVFLLELCQTLLVGRTPDITPVVMVCLAALGVHELQRLGTKAPVTDSESGTTPPASRYRAVSVETQTPPAPWGAVAAAAILLLGGAMMIAWVVRIPSVPYNVRELFLDWFGAKLVFVAAILWLGIASVWSGARLARARHAWLELPWLILGGCLVLLGLLSASVTQESILDIAGSNNLYWFVTHHDIWGSGAARLFEVVGPQFVAALERPIRFTALVGPLILTIAFLRALRDRTRTAKMTAGWMLPLFAATFLSFWLSKAIAFDWSSTDNLNELIARDGPWGIGGGGYLYLLLALFGLTVVLLGEMRASLRNAIFAIIYLTVAVGVGWWLLNEGLEPTVVKYEKVFSGVQFLLGPDRSHALAPVELLLRWTLLFVAGVLALVAGYRIGNRLPPRGWFSRSRLLGRSYHGQSVPSEGTPRTP